MKTKKVRLRKTKLRSVSIHLKNVRSHISEARKLERHLKKLLKDRSLREASITKIRQELKRGLDLVKKDYVLLKSSKLEYIGQKKLAIEIKLKAILANLAKAYRKSR